MFKTKVCLCSYMEMEQWKLLRMSAMQNMLPGCEWFFSEPKTNCLFSSDGTYCFTKKTGRDYEIEKPPPFRKKFSNRNQPQLNLCQKRRKTFFWGTIASTPYWLIQLTKKFFPVSFYTFSVYSKATWFSQSQTMALSRLLTSAHIQLLWL